MSSQKPLFIGMLGGLALALFDLIWTPAIKPLDGSVAQIGSHVIERAQFESTVQGIEDESNRRLSPSERAALLDRMVEEYLLIEYAKSQDLLVVNPALRRQAVDTILQTLREQAASLEPEQDELLQFAQAQAGYFGLQKQEISLQHPELPWEAIRTEWQRRQAEVLLDSLLGTLKDQTSIHKADQP
ncbi:MAG: hypothetical protein R3194_03995 [Limnobacter sp.]|nr:hypothetical protein [Limnobacter sp.]